MTEDGTVPVTAVEERPAEVLPEAGLVFDDPLGRPAGDDTDVGWGDEESGRDEAWYRRETPPHHGD